MSRKPRQLSEAQHAGYRSLPSAPTFTAPYEEGVLVPVPELRQWTPPPSPVV